MPDKSINLLLIIFVIMIDDNRTIKCSRCGFEFERSKEYKYCSNCFACTGCEVYYCPQCDNEIIIKPVTPFNTPETKQKQKKSK